MAIEEGSIRWTSSGRVFLGRERPFFGREVLEGGPVGEVLILGAFLEFVVNVGVRRAADAFLLFNVEDGTVCRAGDTLNSVEEGVVVRAVGDVAVANTPLVILLNEVVDGHVA